MECFAGYNVNLTLCDIPELLKALRQALQALGLDETYDRILGSIRDEDHDYVLRMLKWLVDSERPLALAELAEAIALNPEKEALDPAVRLMVPEDILDLCGSLIRVEENQRTVLAHFSVKEYLLSGRLKRKAQRLAMFALRADDSRQHVTTCMLSYILSIGLRVQSLEHALDEEEFPLLSYVRSLDFSHFQDFDAIQLWMTRHLVETQCEDVKWMFLLDSVKVSAAYEGNYTIAWFVRRSFVNSLMCFWNGHMMQHSAIGTGLNVTRTVQRIAGEFLHSQHAWDSPENADEISRNDGTAVATSPLGSAACFNLEHALRFLLENGALVDGIPWLQFLGNPLIQALRFGNKSIVRILTDFGDNVNIRCPRRPDACALLAAASHSPELVEFLLDEYEVDTNMPDGNGHTIVSSSPVCSGIYWHILILNAS